MSFSHGNGPYLPMANRGSGGLRRRFVEHNLPDP
jgi:hypothetical protein